MVTVTVRGPHPIYIHQSFLSATKVAQVANLRPLLSETPNPRKLGSMVIGSMGCFTYLINGIYWCYNIYNPLILSPLIHPLPGPGTSKYSLKKSAKSRTSTIRWQVTPVSVSPSKMHQNPDLGRNSWTSIVVVEKPTSFHPAQFGGPDGFLLKRPQQKGGCFW